MKKLTKKQKKNLTTGIIVVLLILGIYYSGFLRLQSIVQIREGDYIFPLKTGTFNFVGHPGTYETPYLGSLTSDYNTVISDENNGRTSISNSLVDGSSLKLTSSISGEGRLIENYIKGKVTLPLGTLDVSYEYSISKDRAEASSGPIQITFLVGDVTKSFRIPAGSASKSDSDSFSIILDKEQEVAVSVRTFTHSFRSSSSEGSLNLNFMKTTISVYRLENNQCTIKTIGLLERLENDYDTLAECQENIIEEEIDVYRFEDDKCNLIKIKVGERIESDFDTLEECEQNIPSKTPILPIILVVVLVGGLTYLYIKSKKR